MDKTNLPIGGIIVTAIAFNAFMQTVSFFEIKELKDRTLLNDKAIATELLLDLIVDLHKGD